MVKPQGPMGVYQAADRPVGMRGSKAPHGSHGHMIMADPSGQYIVGADAGRDQIFVWKLDAGTGKLNQVSVTKSVPGAAPRHFAFSPDGKTLYSAAGAEFARPGLRFRRWQAEPPGAHRFRPCRTASRAATPPRSC